MDFDVIIIGSGPAGCAAAITCKKAGLETLIVTNKNLTANIDTLNDELQPSESIHPGIEILLSCLSAVYCVKRASRGVYEGIQTGDTIMPLGGDDKGAWKGNHIDRNIFDTELIHCAINQKVAILDNDSVRDLISKDEWVKGIVTDSNKIITCKYVIDASGYKRFAGRKLRFDEEFFSPQLICWSGVSESCTQLNSFIKNKYPKFIPNPFGWTWIASEMNNKCTWTCLAKKGKQRLYQPIELPEFLLKSKIKAKNRQWKIFRPLCKEGVILCGDAGGTIDPAAGQGILNAILSGIEAAKTIISILNTPEHESFLLTKYDNWFYRNYLDKVKALSKYYDQLGIHVF
jgi:flavin-dependent dehydrogenase